MTENIRFIKIHIGTPYEYVIKDINNNETYGMFKGDDKAGIQLLKTINKLNEENDRLQSKIKMLKTIRHTTQWRMEKMTENKRCIKTGKIDETKFKKYRKIPVTIEAYQTDEEIEIETLEGVMKANKGDYIIKGVKGELYPCKPDVFKLTYEKELKE